MAGAGATIALDAMGGEHAPDMVLRGAEMALQRHPDLRFLLFGAEPELRPLLAKLPRLDPAVSVHHTSEVVLDDDRPSLALRAGRQSSMRLAIDAVADGRADGVVSAGNTGALMAMAKIVLKTLPGIDRPAIASFFPTRRGESVMLDLGANVECDAENLVQFALMGDVFARTVLGLVEPTVGLLNVGSEDLKGNDAVRGRRLRLRGALSPIRFHGFVEGDDIAAGTVDVIVTDGFTGNIAVKTAEGTAKLFSEFLRRRVPPFADGAASAICSPARRCASCGCGSIRAATTARCSWAWAGSRSRATARPMRSASPTRSASPST